VNGDNLTLEDISDEIERLQQAISVLESKRPALGDAVVEAALGPMREKLASLKNNKIGLEPERKFITALFADVTGSTQLGQRLDPEDNMAIMDLALHRYNTIIESYQGRVLRFMGDGLKAIFGSQTVREDDAERAVHAGLALLEETQRYRKEVEDRWGLTGFNLRVGINTGQVVLGGGVEAENSAVGMTINLAARMESSAPPGGLLISYDTYRHVRGLFELQAQPLLTVKGKDEPIQTYLVLGSRQMEFHNTARGVEGVETRMIGRTAELQRLQSCFIETVQNAKYQLVTVVGEPGVGKSRLLLEFELWLDAQPNSVSFFMGRATQQMMDAPYGLLRLMFAHQFRILDSDPASVVRSKIESGFANMFNDESEMKAHFIGALLGFDFPDSPHLVGMQSDPNQLRERALFFLAQYFTTSARKNPVAIFLEDIHWADNSSLDAIQEISNQCSGYPLLIIALTRPDLFEHRPSWGKELAADCADPIRLDITPLSREDSSQLVREILQKVKAIPENLSDLIVATADGNPFYLEELVNILIDDGIILTEQNPGSWRVDSTRLQDLRVPPTLTAVLEARFDGLPSAQKTTLHQAAVVGRTFWKATLQTLQPDAQSLTEQLLDLYHRDLIYLNKPSTFDWTDEYYFKHILMHEVVYENVLKKDRQIYHAKVAGWLVDATRASGREDEYAAVIAEHYSLGGQPGEAVDWYLRAGRHAVAQGAPLEARRFLDTGFNLLKPDDQERLWYFLVERDEVLGVLGESQARQADDAALVALAMEFKDDDRLAEAYRRQAYYFSVVGDDRRAVQAFESGILAANRAGNQGISAIMLALKAISEARLGEMAAAASSGDQALSRVKQVGDENMKAMVLTNLAVYFIERGDIARAAKLLDEQINIYQRNGNRSFEAICLLNLGYNYVLLGLFEEGIEALERSLRISEAIGLRRGVAYGRLNLGLAYFRNGEDSKARQVLESAIPELQAIGDTFGEASGQTYTALTQEQAGEVDAAAKSFSSAKDIFNRIGVQGYAVDASAGLARCWHALGQGDDAEQEARQVWDYIEQQGEKGMEFPILAYLTCANILEGREEGEEAHSIIDMGYRVMMERADKISDGNWRKSFLEKVPEHQALIEMWESFSNK
jgi:class 3 adenylate cyclase/tetratricopeptide (TPR) repeat protein